MPYKPNKHISYFTLLEGLEDDGCVICNLVLRVLTQYMESLVYERVNDPEVRKNLRQSQGFCAAHGEMLRNARSVLGSAVIHRDLIHHLMGQLKKQSYPTGTPQNWFQELLEMEDHLSPVLSPEKPCPACALVYQNEQSNIDLLLEHWDDETLNSAFTKSSGLCLPHLRMALGRTKDRKRFNQLQQVQLGIWQKLLSQLDEFIRKQDYRFSHEPLGEERDSWSRAIDLVSSIWRVAGSRDR